MCGRFAHAHVYWPARPGSIRVVIGVLQVEVGQWVRVLVLGSGGIEEWPGVVTVEYDELDTDKSTRRVCKIWHLPGPYGSSHTSTYVRGRATS